MAGKGRLQQIEALSEPAAVDGGGGGPHDPRMDALIQRVDRLEDDVKGIKGSLERLEPLIVRIDERLKSMVTKDELAETRNSLKDELVATRDSLKDDLRRIGERTARIEGAVKRMPTTLQLLGFVLAVLGIAGLAKYFAP